MVSHSRLPPRVARGMKRSHLQKRRTRGKGGTAWAAGGGRTAWREGPPSKAEGRRLPPRDAPPAARRAPACDTGRDGPLCAALVTVTD